LIAAEWVVTLGGVVGGLELAEVSGLLVMVENNLLVKFA
jgi:hypothetical protein